MPVYKVMQTNGKVNKSNEIQKDKANKLMLEKWIIEIEDLQGIKY